MSFILVPGEEATRDSDRTARGPWPNWSRLSFPGERVMPPTPAITDFAIHGAGPPPVVLAASADKECATCQLACVSGVHLSIKAASGQHETAQVLRACPDVLGVPSCDSGCGQQY
jgi:hypothetical protein